MQKILNRIVALLLVSCLAADPVTASALRDGPQATSDIGVSFIHRACPGVHSAFEEQAISPVERWFNFLNILGRASRVIFQSTRLPSEYSVDRLFVKGKWPSIAIVVGGIPAYAFVPDHFPADRLLGWGEWPLAIIACVGVGVLLWKAIRGFANGFRNGFNSLYFVDGTPVPPPFLEALVRNNLVAAVATALRRPPREIAEVLIEGGLTPASMQGERLQLKAFIRVLRQAFSAYIYHVEVLESGSIGIVFDSELNGPYRSISISTAGDVQPWVTFARIRVRTIAQPLTLWLSTLSDQTFCGPVPDSEAPPIGAPDAAPNPHGQEPSRSGRDRTRPAAPRRPNGELERRAFLQAIGGMLGTQGVSPRMEQLAAGLPLAELKTDWSPDDFSLTGTIIRLVTEAHSDIAAFASNPGTDYRRRIGARPFTELSRWLEHEWSGRKAALEQSGGAGRLLTGFVEDQIQKYLAAVAEARGKADPADPWARVFYSAAESAVANPALSQSQTRFEQFALQMSFDGIIVPAAEVRRAAEEAARTTRAGNLTSYARYMERWQNRWLEPALDRAMAAAGLPYAHIGLPSEVVAKVRDKLLVDLRDALDRSYYPQEGEESIIRPGHIATRVGWAMQNLAKDRFYDALQRHNGLLDARGLNYGNRFDDRGLDAWLADPVQFLHARYLTAARERLLELIEDHLVKKRLLRAEARWQNTDDPRRKAILESLQQGLGKISERDLESALAHPKILTKRIEDGIRRGNDSFETVTHWLEDGQYGELPALPQADFSRPALPAPSQYRTPEVYVSAVRDLAETLASMSVNSGSALTVYFDGAGQMIKLRASGGGRAIVMTGRELAGLRSELWKPGTSLPQRLPGQEIVILERWIPAGSSAESIRQLLAEPLTSRRWQRRDIVSYGQALGPAAPLPVPAEEAGPSAQVKDADQVPAAPPNLDSGHLAQMPNPAQGAGESTNRVSDAIMGAGFLMAAGLAIVNSGHPPAHLLSSLMVAIPLIGMAFIDRRSFLSGWFKHDDIPPCLSAILESMGLSLETLPAALNNRPEIRRLLMDRVAAHLRQRPEDLADVQRFVADSPSRSVVLAETVNRREIGQEMLGRLLRPVMMPVLPGPPLPKGDSDIQAAPTPGPFAWTINRRLFLQMSAAAAIRPTPGKDIVASAFRDPFEFLSSLPFILSNPTLFDLMADLCYDMRHVQSASELSLSVEQAIAQLISGKANQRLSLRLLWEIEYGLFEAASAFVQWGIPVISGTPELNLLGESSPLVQAPGRIPPLESAWRALDLDGLNAVRGLMDPWDKLWADLKLERRISDGELERDRMLYGRLNQVVVDRHRAHLKTMATQLAQHPWMQKQMRQLEAIRATRRSDLLPGMLQGTFPINEPQKEAYNILYQLQDLYQLQSRFTAFRHLLDVTSAPELALDGSRLLSQLIKQGPGFLHDPEWEHWYSLSRDFWSLVMPDALMLQEPPSTPGDRAISIDRQMRREGLRLTLPPIQRAWSELMNGRGWMMGPSHEFRFLRHGISALRRGKGRYEGWLVDQFDLTHPELPTAPLSTNRLIREPEKRPSPEALAEPARAAIAEPAGSSDLRQPPGNIPMSDSPPIAQVPAAGMSPKSPGPRPYANPQLEPPSLKLLGPAAEPSAPASAEGRTDRILHRLPVVGREAERLTTTLRTVVDTLRADASFYPLPEAVLEAVVGCAAGCEALMERFSSIRRESSRPEKARRLEQLLAAWPQDIRAFKEPLAALLADSAVASLHFHHREDGRYEDLVERMRDQLRPVVEAFIKSFPLDARHPGSLDALTSSLEDIFGRFKLTDFQGPEMTALRSLTVDLREALRAEIGLGISFNQPHEALEEAIQVEIADLVQRFLKRDRSNPMFQSPDWMLDYRQRRLNEGLSEEASRQWLKVRVASAQRALTDWLQALLGRDEVLRTRRTLAEPVDRKGVLADELGRMISALDGLGMTMGALRDIAFSPASNDRLWDGLEPLENVYRRISKERPVQDFRMWPVQTPEEQQMTDAFEAMSDKELADIFPAMELPTGQNLDGREADSLYTFLRDDYWLTHTPIQLSGNINLGQIELAESQLAQSIGETEAQALSSEFRKRAYLRVVFRRWTQRVPAAPLPVPAEEARPSAHGIHALQVPSGEITRLDTNAARQAVLASLRAFLEQTNRFADLCVVVANVLKGHSVSGLQDELLPDLRKTLSLIKQIYGEIRFIPSITGLTQPEQRQQFEGLLSQLCRDFQANAAIIQGTPGSVQYSYSLGLSEAHLRFFKEHEGAMGFASVMGDSLIRRENPHEQVRVFLFRTKEMADQHGSFSGAEQKRLRQVLEAQLTGGMAIWPTISQELAADDFGKFDVFMTMLRHNGSISIWKNELFSWADRLIRTLEAAVLDPSESLPADILTMSAYMKEIAAGDEVFETLLTEGEVYVPMDIGPAIRRWAEPYRRPLADKGIALVVDIPEGIHFTAIVDCKLLKILVDNLLQNAVKYTDYGSVAVRLSMGSMELGRSGGDHRSGIILEVSDTGIGIPEGDMEHVFLRGARASNVLNQRPGTGKGLWIVGLIARCMSGGYQVSSHEREGSTFRILIPPLQPAGPDKDLPVQSNSDTHIGLLRRSS